MNVNRVVFDANKQVGETDENNSYQIRVNVKIDCDGDGKVAGVASPAGGLKQAPAKPDPDPAQPRSLRLKPVSKTSLRKAPGQGAAAAKRPDRRTGSWARRARSGREQGGGREWQNVDIRVG